jgi:predicted nuclease with TOPRIM domain
MSQPIKITEQEFSEIKLLQNKFQELIFKLGTLQVEKMQLDAAVTAFVDKETKLKEEWTSLQKLEDGLLDKVVQKYGEGNLNMADGTFIQTSPPAPTQ